MRKEILLVAALTFNAHAITSDEATQKAEEWCKEEAWEKHKAKGGLIRVMTFKGKNGTYDFSGSVEHIKNTAKKVTMSGICAGQVTPKGEIVGGVIDIYKD